MFDFKVFNRIEDANLDKRINAYIKRVNGKTVREELHLLLSACAHHGGKNGNSFDKLSNLYNRLPEHINKKGAGIWINTFLPNLQWKKDKAGNYKWLGVTTYILAGDATPFYEMEKVKQANKPFDFWSAVTALFEREEARMKKAKDGELPSGAAPVTQQEQSAFHEMAKTFDTFKKAHDKAKKVATGNVQVQAAPAN